MSRLERKCLVASGGLHLFLVLIVLFGSAFFKARKPEPPLQMLNVVPSRLVDEALAGGGGNPNLPRTDAKIQGDTLTPLPPPAPEPPAPEPKAPKPQTRPEPKPPEPTPEPPKPKTTKAAEAPPKITKAAKDPVKPKADEPVKPRIDLSELRPVTRDDSAKEKQKAKEEAEAREAAAARAAAAAAARDRARKAAALADAVREFSGAQNRLRTGFKGGTEVDVGGPGGAAFANYKLFVQMAYENAWIITPELTDDDFVAQIKVTVTRTGRIVASRITRASGSATMDRTVQRAMDRVRSDGLPPFPAGATDQERTFTIEFNLKAKNRLG